MPDFEVLFRKVDSGGAGPGQYLAGDVVTLRPWPNNGWGALDDPTIETNNFYSAVITGVPSLQDLQELIEAVEDAGGVMLQRRGKKIDILQMPNNVRNKLERDGTITGTWTQVQSYIADRL